MTVRFATALLVPLVLSGCALLPGAPSPAQTGVDGEACVGEVRAAAPGLAEAANPALLGQARFASGKGGTCTAKVFTVAAPVLLYRVFDSGRPYSRLGGWWSLTRPAGPLEAYRAAYAICPEWSNLDRVVACEVRPGSQIVIGTTQSATCADGSTYPRTGENQVYVANDGKAGIVHVGTCSEAAAWP
ncbi:hypothetical protein N8I74_00390 [Chitiniphilus purpureus]|uniref:DUF333 domain-containing protein n=1 Tax=Chitiniphilus purpureus TaxID=2981137 RepID=A0ABY6DMC8_9NEIS|nr:hypothetical protein [Chitiniphilus sp. CD1]UXY15509.1 hypothetical protein N8I74_00390 [Chitiniphilus sp. CD1]